MKTSRIGRAAALLLMVTTITLIPPSTLRAQVPQIISYQGRVAVGSPAVNFDGPGLFRFALVNGDGSVVYWGNSPDTRPADGVPNASVTLTVTKGLYSVLLGDTSLGANMAAIPNSVFANSDVRLRVWFDDGTANGLQLLAPDQRIAAVGYAMVAASVPGIVPDNGNIGVGTAVPDSRLHVNGDGANPALRVQVLGNSKLTVDPNGGTSLGASVTAPDAPPANGLYVAGSVGIGILTPTSALEVAGTVTASAFAGDGSGLTNIPASAVVPVVPPAPPAGMVLIPEGAFIMGDTTGGASGDSVIVSATISTFYMDETEVTKAQWDEVKTWGAGNGYTDLPTGAGKAIDHPVQTVSWYAVVKWCNARSEKEGKTPVYYTDDAQTTVYRTGDVNVTNLQVKWEANGFRLPTEAEWEKAARGGLSGQLFPWGNAISQSLANYLGNTSSFAYDQGPDGYNAIGSVGGTSPATSPVGSFAPNGYGLHDMAGNVFEWCWDRYSTTGYAGGTDPHGSETTSSRVIRSGSWAFSAISARCARRNVINPAGGDDDIGFRVVLAPGQP